jgi:hypothetical protein
MTTVEAIGWRKKFHREMLWLGALFVPLLVIGALRTSYALIGLGLAVGVFGFFFQRRMFRTWKCEKCGKKLHAAPKDGERISFPCEACNVEWDTKVYKDLS